MQRLPPAGLLVLSLAFAGAEAGWPAYRKMAKSDVPYGPNIGARHSNLADAAAACSADPSCKAYNSDGGLKACAGCEGGSDCCVYPAGAMDFPPADRVDLFVKTGSAPPAEWAAGVAQGSVLYAQPEPDICMMPEVGNGYVASIVGFSSMHVSGFFNGGCGGVSKAHLPSVIGISVTNSDANLTQAALDMRRAVYVPTQALSVLFPVISHSSDTGTSGAGTCGGCISVAQSWNNASTPTASASTCSSPSSSS